MVPTEILYLCIIFSFREKYEKPRETRLDSGMSLAGGIDILCVVGVCVFSSLLRSIPDSGRQRKTFHDFQHKRMPDFAVNDLNKITALKYWRASAISLYSQME